MHQFPYPGGATMTSLSVDDLKLARASLTMIESAGHRICTLDSAPIWFYARGGICSNLDTLMGGGLNDRPPCTSWLLDVAALWPGHSGNRTYPVPAPQGLRATPAQLAVSAINKWTGAYGMARLELVQFLEWTLGCEQARRATSACIDAATRAACVDGGEDPYPFTMVQSSAAHS